ncbi:Caffeate CoA-transferase [subsurface metagenome]
MAPKMAKMILDNEMEAYNFPQGVISHMFGAVAGKKPGIITKVGLYTYIDPRLEGGKMNSITKEDLVKIIEIDNQEWLFFPRFHIDVALVRGTTADTKGNITSEEEGAFLEGISIAQAAKNCGGIVIAQVKYLTKEGTLSAQSVKIPGIYVDFIVVDANQKQTCLDFYNPSFSGQVKIPLERIQPIPLDIKKVIAERAYREIFNGAIVNLGVGIPSGIAAVAIEQGRIDDYTLTIEQGSIGGMPAGGVIFGVSYNPTAIIEEDAQFNFYDGGGLDLGFLGMAEADQEGNVNSSKVGNMLSGCGGFINISQNAKKSGFLRYLHCKGTQVPNSRWSAEYPYRGGNEKICETCKTSYL